MSQSYGDLAAARDAMEKTMHGGTSLKKIFDAASFPAETLGGTGMVRMGRGIQNFKGFDPKTSLFMGAATPKRKEDQ